ncbi:uncharacterized protein V1516DRAFT_665380 [Lipomyces oligophaga]|uniref:uncharacterized protein n=1 Tax=Lipomyces oligophaga TaxID=45792 RepID=UPI0034CE2439
MVDESSEVTRLTKELFYKDEVIETLMGWYQTIADHHECSMCMNLMFEPRVTECGHCFCYLCITSWLKKSNTCPTCMGKLDKDPRRSIHMNQSVDLIFENLCIIHPDEDIDYLTKRRTTAKKLAAAQDLSISCTEIGKLTFRGSRSEQPPNDSVAYCPECEAEVYGEVCLNCGLVQRRPLSASPQVVQSPLYYESDSE